MVTTAQTDGGRMFGLSLEELEWEWKLEGGEEEEAGEEEEDKEEDNEAEKEGDEDESWVFTFLATCPHALCSRASGVSHQRL